MIHPSPKTVHEGVLSLPPRLNPDMNPSVQVAPFGLEPPVGLDGARPMPVLGPPR